jgi:hypothetical protein
LNIPDPPPRRVREIAATDLDHVLLGDALRDADNERDLRLQRLHNGRRSTYIELVLYTRMK